MYKRMKNSVLRQRIGKLIRELEEDMGADTRSTDEQTKHWNVKRLTIKEK